MEAAVALLILQRGEQEFLRISRMALKIIQNILSDPGVEKYRRVRTASKYAAQQGVPELLQALGFEPKGEYYVLSDSTAEPSVLLERKAQLMGARRQVHSILGWDVPSSALQFSALLGSGRYGDIFRGQMDGREVTVKTVKPDCGEVARESFDRELDYLSKLNHPNIVKLVAVTLTSEPTALVLEYVGSSMLDVLHRSELSDSDILSYAKQVAVGMEYLHSCNILHCDLAARNLLLDSAGVVKISDLGLSRRDGSVSCRLPSSLLPSLRVRWTAPDVLKQLFFSKHSDVWSYGMVLYELVTGGCVPYANFSNSEVKAKVLEGYRLPQPQGSADEFYSLMLWCWALRATERPRFPDIVRNHLAAMETKLAGSERLTRQTSEESSVADLKSPKGSKKHSKVKEPSYQVVAGKGGGLVRVYTALISPFHHRVVVVCSKKATVAEVVHTALSKCGKHDLDAKSHSIALVRGQSSGSPAHYLDSDDRILSVKVGASPTAMFVLCVHMPGAALLEVIDSVRQNPAYGSAFDPCTRGYLMWREEVGGGGGKGKEEEWQRHWCVLDGSTLLCYTDEEDEGVKQFHSFLNFRGCSVTPASGKKGNLFKLDTAEGDHYLFSATDKADSLQWMEAIETAATLAVSTMLLHTSGGAVVHTGFLECQEFAYEMNGVSPLQPMMQRRIGVQQADIAGTFAAVDYGKHWTVIKSSGLVQCLVEGRPETLLDLSECKRVRVHNPKEMREGVEFSIEVEGPDSRFVLKAEVPTDHFDWVLAVERILREKGLERVLVGHRNRESSYVVLKRLLMMRRGMETYSFPRSLDDMEEIYDTPPPPPPSHLQKNPHSGARQSELLQQSPSSVENTVPLPPRDYLPPPLPPRDNLPPPLPPRGKTTSPNSRRRPPSTGSNNSSGSVDLEDEYVLMQPKAHHSGSSPTHRPSPTTPTSPGSYPQLVRSLSQPITIPNRRSGKRSALLRADSESSSITGSPPYLGSSLSDLQEQTEWGSRLTLSRNPSVSSSRSLYRDTSSYSLNGHSRQLSSDSFNATPPLPPRNGERSSGYNSPLLDMSPSPGLHRSHSNRLNVTPRLPPRTPSTSRSDGMMVSEAQHHFASHPISTAGSLAQSLGSVGYCSSNSSSEDISQLPPGWERGYCDNNSRYFYFNSQMGVSTWSIQEVLVHCQPCKESNLGDGWRVVRMDNGRVYYYHEVTRKTTWDVQDTWA